MLAALACAVVLPVRGAPTAFHGADVTGADWGRQLEAADHDGRLRRLADFRGQVVVLAFGYLQCPNFCPTTLARLAEVRQRLGADASRLQVIFVTLDPERDSAAALKAYVGAFAPDFLGLRPEPGREAALAREFRIYYRKVPAAAGHYDIDHTTSLRVLDVRGRLRLRLPDELDAPAVAADLARLLVEAAPEPRRETGGSAQAN